MPTQKEKAIAFLNEHSIPFECFDHQAVFTVEEVTKHVKIKRGIRTKNLFVRDKRGRRHVLIVLPHDKSVDLEALGKMTGLGRVSFASPERLMKFLGVEPGSVTLMGVINDRDRAVEVVMDTAIWAAESVRCHPLVNTSTIVLDSSGLRAVFEATGHDPVILNIPSR